MLYNINCTDSTISIETKLTAKKDESSEKFGARPLYMDAQATTLMVNILDE